MSTSVDPINEESVEVQTEMVLTVLTVLKVVLCVVMPWLELMHDQDFWLGH